MKRVRINSNVPPELAKEVKDKVKKLGYPSVSAFVEAAIQNLLGHADVVKENQQLRESLRACEKEKADSQEQVRQLTCDLEEAQNNLMSAQFQSAENIRQIATKLGVPDTVHHCQQRIEELGNCIEQRENERDEAINAKSWTSAERDQFKRKYEDSLVAYNKSQSKLHAYQHQGFWGRVFNLVPKGD